jgi:hypothetical protein
MSVDLFTGLRWFISGLYAAALGFSLAWAFDGRGIPFPFAAAALTFAYGMLMMLLWLYQRYPPR